MARSILLLTIGALAPAICAAASPSEQVAEAGENGQYAFVMFYRANDQPTQAMASAIESHVGQSNGTTTWVRVNVADKEQSSLVKRFNASRTPLPTAFGVAPNGAVTGVFRRSVTSEQLSNAILTPKYSEMVQALQSQKIAVVCLKPTAETATPAGFESLQKMAAFQGKMHAIVADATDSAEAEFFRRMKVDARLDSPVVLMFAPPGNYLGSYPATTSAIDLAKALHSTGKCNCHDCQTQRSAK